jgi:hypothetical protein
VTYPQYQPPAPAAPPQGYPSQSYAPAYPPAAPLQQQPAQGQAITPPVPTLRDGSSGGGNPAPKFRHLLGRTIIVEPIRVDENAMDTSVNPPVVRPEAYFHLTVCDGGPVRYGDSQDRDVSKQRPNTHEIDTPCRFTNVNDRSYGFVQAVRDALNAGEHGRLGVVQQGTKGNKPYLITKCNTDVLGNARPDGDARFAAAMEIFGKIWHDKHAPGEPKQFVNPEPRSLVAPPAAAPAQVAYGAPATPPQGYAPAGYAAQPYPQQQGYGVPVPTGPTFASPALVDRLTSTPQSAPPAAAPAVDPAYAAWLASQQAMRAEQQFQAGPYGDGMMAPPVAPAVPPQPLPPPVEAWLASLPAEQQVVSRAAYIAQQQGQPAAATAPSGPGI